MIFDQPFGGLVPGARGAVLAVLLRTGAGLTGRQVHRLVGEGHSLRSVQQALALLVEYGLVKTEDVGRARVHSVNLDHYAVAPLRALLDPMAALRAVVNDAGSDGRIHAVLLFGSVARGEATAASDVDLAVIADGDWPGRIDLRQAVATRLGCRCDVVVFTPDEFARLADDGEPVVLDIRREAVPLWGVLSQVTDRLPS